MPHSSDHTFPKQSTDCLLSFLISHLYSTFSIFRAHIIATSVTLPTAERVQRIKENGPSGRSFISSCYNLFYSSSYLLYSRAQKGPPSLRNLS
jgi:hypothetical protein